MGPAHPEGLSVVSRVSDVHTAAHHEQNVQQTVEFVQNAALCWRIIVHLILSTDLKILPQKTCDTQTDKQIDMYIQMIDKDRQLNRYYFKCILFKISIYSIKYTF